MIYWRLAMTRYNQFQKWMVITKLAIFDDFVCEKNQAPLIDYFIGGRHKNCSVRVRVIMRLRKMSNWTALISVYTSFHQQTNQNHFYIVKMVFRKRCMKELRISLIPFFTWTNHESSQLKISMRNSNLLSNIIVCVLFKQNFWLGRRSSCLWNCGVERWETGQWNRFQTKYWL